MGTVPNANPVNGVAGSSSTTGPSNLSRGGGGAESSVSDYVATEAAEFRAAAASLRDLARTTTANAAAVDSSDEVVASASASASTVLENAGNACNNVKGTTPGMSRMLCATKVSDYDDINLMKFWKLETSKSSNFMPVAEVSPFERPSATNIIFPKVLRNNKIFKFL